MSRCLLTILIFLSLGRKAESQHLEKERVRWNKTLTQDTLHFNTQANSLLVKSIKDIRPGKALDLGMGQGRNSIYLARQGWQVTGIDIADEAVTVALEKAKKEKLKIDARLIPIEDFDFGISQWDLIVNVYEGCLNDHVKVERIANALKSNGVFVFEFFHRDAGIEMNRPEFGCRTNSVKEAIESTNRFTIILYEETIGKADFGLAQRKLVKMVAVKK